MRRAVLYADVFDYPLTRDEVFAFLDTAAASRASVEAAIDHALANGSGLDSDGLYLHVGGRSEIVATRRRRAIVAASAWRRGRFYARLIWAIPYVRMVAVTGALAVNNVEDGDDIDFLIVTEPGRLWMARGMTVLLCRLARMRGDVLCPNYIITMKALRLRRQDLYTAHEFAQVVPLHGARVAHRLRSENQWYLDILPNLDCEEPLDVRDDLPWPLATLKSLAEAILRLPPGDAVERWERERKIARLSRRQGPGDEAVFSADMCKGHYHGHGERVMRLYASRVAKGGVR